VRDVFVSYSTHDKTIADVVCATLEANGLRCWIAPRDIVPGMNWGDAIIDAINTSRVMVLVFSSQANTSQQIRREVEQAVEQGLIIVPLRIEQVTPTQSLAYFLGPVQWLDALTPPLESHLQTLARAVRLLLSRTGTAQSPTASGNAPVEMLEQESQQVRMPEQRLTETHTRPTRGKFKRTAIILLAVCALGLGVTFYDLWHPGDHGPIWEALSPKEAPKSAMDHKESSGSGITARPTTPLILFEEHFSNNSHQWLESSNDEKRSAITDGNYIIESKVEGSWWHATVPVAITQNEDFKIECLVKKIDGVNNFGHGLIWGLKDRDNFYVFLINGNGSFTVRKKKDGNIIRIIPWSISNSIKKLTSNNKLAIEKEDDKMLFYINGIFVGRAPFEPLFGNRIGFSVEDKQTIAFDDLIVTVKNK
jgi:hypothetical protein